MTRQRYLYFGTAYAVTHASGCPEEGIPFEIETDFIGATRKDAEEFVARSGWRHSRSQIEERQVLTDGVHFLPQEAESFDDPADYRDMRKDVPKKKKRRKRRSA